MMRPGPVVRGCVQLNFGSFAPPHDANDVKFDEMIAGIFTVFSTVGILIRCLWAWLGGRNCHRDVTRFMIAFFDVVCIQ